MVEVSFVLLATSVSCCGKAQHAGESALLGVAHVPTPFVSAVNIYNTSKVRIFVSSILLQTGMKT